MSTPRPLPRGTRITYCGMDAVVVQDDGSRRIVVDCEGHVQNWYWSFEGVECEVIADMIRPLKPGTRIKGGDQIATVVKDEGDEHLTVSVGGQIFEWYWLLDGIECEVIQE